MSHLVFTYSCSHCAKTVSFSRPFSTYHDAIEAPWFLHKWSPKQPASLKKNPETRTIGCNIFPCKKQRKVGGFLFRHLSLLTSIILSSFLLVFFLHFLSFSLVSSFVVYFLFLLAFFLHFSFFFSGFLLRCIMCVTLTIPFCHICSLLILCVHTLQRLFVRVVRFFLL